MEPGIEEGEREPERPQNQRDAGREAFAEGAPEAGIGAVHSNQDYSSTIKGYSWNYSYKYSKQTVKQAMAEHQDLQFFFDIHRDALRRKDSTVEIDGTSYAQVYFVIGRGNPDWRENEKFAKEIHDRLENKYPGISRGIWGKSTAQGNGEYNQSLSPNSVIMEIGASTIRWRKITAPQRCWRS